MQMIHNIPQPDFEKFLTETLVQNSLVEIRKGVSFVSLEQVRGSNVAVGVANYYETSKTVLTQVEERVTGHLYHIRSKYVVACDGARSKVRDFLRIASEGEDSCRSLASVFAQH
jgi:2-polyprenyl-6-methoxyphenol hydroxylase-like FAD-dependent oxidoreductase